ncbi:solute carrier organic anion transporter family member 74D [Schistocerca piceifrons]|uniref:solute carrier organic anion transporter family member 74D n=1 Tax=Schistocerca piceifrons TaxID=274613 RepID=UPI001F5F415C|nr:solute carrier organic anion transporter family member 74D [Schistocerca piceifrons]XP_049762907.1 solute carrier organic anion transporter family member 74D [Schistocerca cancellata]
MSRSAEMSSECGLGTWLRPAWLSRFATSRAFLAVYGLLGTTQAMAVMYFVATLTTLEKRFKIPSKTTGLMMTGNELSQILLSLFLAYYGGRGNRPVWIAWGVALSGISCFMLALPHVIYGAGGDALALTLEYQEGGALYNTSALSGVNTYTEPLCNATHTEADECTSDFSIMPLVLVFLSQFVLGIGTTLYYALGQTYLDDNAKTTRTPLLLGAVLALRTTGPALGFIMGYLCLNLYIEPGLTPIISKRDPRWLGAWWLGWIILGFVMLLFSLLIAMFPKQLPKAAARDRARTSSFARRSSKTHRLNSSSSVRSLSSPEQEPLTKKHTLDDFIPDDPVPVSKTKEANPFGPTLHETRPSLSDFKESLKRMLKNKLLMVNIFASVFYVLGASGYVNFIVKYMETQFQQSAAKANGVAGVLGIIAMASGFIVSGYVISKFQPRAVLLLGWNVIVGFGYIAAEIIMMFVRCPGNIPHKIGSECSNFCDCTGFKYAPLCHEETKEVFYSACQAGCTSFIGNETHKIYSNCHCIEEEQVVLVSGLCSVDCSHMLGIFIALLFTMHFIGSTGKVGNVLVNYRCVDAKDKPLASALTLLLVSLLAFIPGPILFGAIIDSSCLEWDISCGKRGNCWLYDQDKFRHYINGTAAVITIMGVILDAVVCYLGRNMEFYDPEEIQETKKQQLKS